MPRSAIQNPLLQLRELKRQYRQDYAAASPSRFRRTRTGLYGSGDAHYASEFQFIRVREYARDMERNDAIVGAILDRALDNVVRDRFVLEPQTGDRKLDHDQWQRWDAWANDSDECDIAGEWTFPDFERFAFRGDLRDGDFFLVGTEDGPLQAFEADRCRTPTNSRRNIVHGVLLDTLRRREGYYFTREEIDPFSRVTRVSDCQFVDTRDASGLRVVFHVYDPTRVSQTRGVTAFHAVFDTCGMWEDTNFALLVKQQIVSCFGLFLEQEMGAPATDVQVGERTNITLADGQTDGIEEGLSPGAIIRGRPGQKATAFNANIPSAEAMAHIRFLLQIIGINLGLPLICVLLDAAETNFSGWRGAMDQAKLGFICNQERLKRRLHRPVYKWKVSQWLAEDAALRHAAEREGIDVFGHKWNAPRWPYVQPLQDAQADSLRLQNLLASPTQVHAEAGRDYDDVLAETIRDNASAVYKAIRAAQRITQKTKVDVHWRDILNRELPRGGEKVIEAANNDAKQQMESEQQPRRARALP